MNIFRFLLVFLFLFTPHFSFSQVETKIDYVPAITFGEGEHIVIAIHGSTQSRTYFFSDYGSQFGPSLAKEGFKVIAISWPDQQGFMGGFPSLSLAIKYARDTGAKKISLLGHSRGAELAINYARSQGDGVFDTVIFLGSPDDKGLSLPNTKKLFAFSKNDSYARWQQGAFDKSDLPKQIIVIAGGGHGVRDMVKSKPDLLDEIISYLRR